MRSVILDTRFQILSSNLAKVRGVMELAQRRGQDLAGLRASLFGPDSLTDSIKSLRKTVNYLKADLDAQQETSDEAVTHITDALNIVNRAMAQLDACRTATDALLGPRVELAARDIRRLLEQSVTDRLGALQTALDDPTATWNSEAELASKFDPLFGEYVDLLRGLALRESGIERGICDLAERLLDGCDRLSQWKSVAIPSHRSPPDMAATRMVYLRFPEWTIWALPLAAHELGRLVASQDRALRDKIKSEDAAAQWPAATIEAALADAFAAYAVGPAYGCAAIMMRLDPRAVAPGGPPVDDARARMIFEMLKIADEKAGPAIGFDEVTKPALDAWNEALKEAGAVAGSDDAPRKLAAVFWIWAERSILTAKYQPQAWIKAQRLRDVLDRRISEAPPLPEDAATIAAGSTDVRDMLNAAWLYRLGHHDQADAAGDAILALWQEAKARLQPATKPGGAAVPGPQERSKT